MTAAAIGINGGLASISPINVAVGATVTLLDLGTGTPDERTWTIQRYPGPLASAPALSPDAVSSSVTFTASESGGYIVHLSRKDSGVTTTKQAFVGVVDSRGFIIPCSGLTADLIQVTGAIEESQEEGWMGHTRASSQVFLDAILRSLLTNATKLGHKIDIIGSAFTNNTTTYSEGGIGRMTKADFDTDKLTKYKLQAYVQTTAALDTVSILLRDLTNAADIVTLGPYAHTTATFVESAEFSLPAGADVDFAVRHKLNVTGSPNIATIKGAWLKLVP